VKLSVPFFIANVHRRIGLKMHLA